MPRRSGRPAIQIDLKKVQSLAGIGCTLDEVAEVLQISKRTLVSRRATDKAIKEAFEQGVANMKMSLRHDQMQAAHQDPTILIWLGKQHLGQRDIVENQLTGKDGERLNIVISSDDALL